MNNTLLLQQFDLLATAPGGVAKLRELILTLAVQGKLLPQNPADEPASALLKRIRAEKDRLMAEGKIKRDKPLAAIGEGEQPFGLPVGWEWVRLGELVNLTYGKNLPTTSLSEDGFPVFGANGVIGRYREYLYDEEQLLISCRGAYSGKPNISPKKCFVTNNSIVCEFVARSMVDLVFFYRQLQISDKSRLVTGSAQPQVTIGNADPLVLAVPPLPEQARIVARVEELMRVCDALEATGQRQAAHHRQLVQTLLGDLTAASHTPWQRVAAHFDTLLDRPSAVDALEQTILQLVVRGQLVPQDPTDEPASALLKRIRAGKDRLIAEGKIKRDKPLAPIGEDEQPFELPPGWEWVRLGDVWQSSFYGPRFGNEEYVSKGGIPTIRTTDMSNGQIVLKNPPFVNVPLDKYDAYLVQRGDLLVTRSGSIGVMALFDLDIDAVPSAYLIRLRFSELMLPKYCLEYFLSELGQRQLGLSTTAVGVPNVSASKMADFAFPLPPLPEQARIVARMAHLRRLCADLRQRLIQSQTALAEALVAQLP